MEREKTPVPMQGELPGPTSELHWSIAVAETDGTPTITLQELYNSPDCPAFLRRTLSGSFTWQNRNRRQAQRALISPGIAPQFSAALLAAGATVELARDSDVRGPVPLASLLEHNVQGKPVSLRVPVHPRLGQASVARSPADEPIVAAYAGVCVQAGSVREARVALTGTWSRPVGLAQAAARLVGHELTKERILETARAIQAEVVPEGDFRGSDEYRRAMAGVLARRALQQCMEEAGHA